MMIQALTLDLDDTLWPVEPVIAHAEQCLQEWLALHCPKVASRFPIPQMRALRDRVFEQHPHLHHDFTALRKISLRQAFAASGHDEALAEHAFDVFFAARNEVQLYDDAAAALTRLSARHPLASLSNGNADLHRIGIAEHFQRFITARQFGQAKPHPAIFLHACEQLNCTPNQVAHVGDDPVLDVMGAKCAGLFAIWVNRNRLAWQGELEPDLTVHDLHQLADWLDGHAD